jgi:hypothetical protein
MRNLFLYIIFLFSLAACTHKAAEKPAWINQTEILSFPKDSLVFTAKGNNWKAILQSFTQPVPLNIQFTKDGFILSTQNKYGITEGTAQLILSNGTEQFYYHLNLQNSSSGAVTDIDYRSPKTVNPDSSLAQHRMLHTIDEWRNILNAQQQLQPFYEDIIQLTPVAGTFRAQKEKALSSFYVQPGSATTITVSSVYNKEEKVFRVTAGPLKDKHNNTVANGTMVVFIYSDNEQTYRIEAALLNGFAGVKIPAEKNKGYRLMAKVNETVSGQIQLLPK